MPWNWEIPFGHGVKISERPNLTKIGSQIWVVHSPTPKWYPKSGFDPWLFQFHSLKAVATPFLDCYWVGSFVFNFLGNKRVFHEPP